MNMHWGHFLSLHLLRLWVIVHILRPLIVYIEIEAIIYSILRHIENLRLLLLGGPDNAVLMNKLLMSILMILNLLCYLLQVNNLLSLVCCRIRLASWRCRNIAMWKMTMNTLTTRLNLIFADSDIWKFWNRNNLFLSECAHLICRLRHMTTTLGVRTIVVKLQLLRENTAILTWCLDVNLRLILLRGSCGPWRM